MKEKIISKKLREKIILIFDVFMKEKVVTSRRLEELGFSNYRKIIHQMEEERMIVRIPSSESHLMTYRIINHPLDHKEDRS